MTNEDFIKGLKLGIAIASLTQEEAEALVSISKSKEEYKPKKTFDEDYFNSKWAKEKITPNQIKELKRLGYDGDLDISKLDAWELINNYKKNQEEEITYF